MTEYRVTKYNPQFRGADGRYLDDDWTSISDVGRSFNGRPLKLSDYLTVEDAYVESVRVFLEAAKISALRVAAPEAKNTAHLHPPELRKQYENKTCYFPEGKEVLGNDIDWVIRLNLREVFWCRLEGDRELFVHFGWDYYMYFGIGDPAFICPSLPPLMFLEPCESPYKLNETKK